MNSSPSLALNSWLHWSYIFCSESCSCLFISARALTQIWNSTLILIFTEGLKIPLDQCTYMRFIKDLKKVYATAKTYVLWDYFILPVTVQIFNTCQWVLCQFSLCIILRSTLCFSLVCSEPRGTINCLTWVLFSTCSLLCSANRRHKPEIRAQ